MTQFLIENKILLLFLVIASGYLIGKIKIKGFSLGVSAVLFTGLAFGSLDKEMVLPDIIYVVGLVIFVYTIGLQSGASFFDSLKKNGLRDNLFIVVMLIAAFILTFGLSVLFSLTGSLSAGVYCGALTNTPALAAVIEVLKQSNSGLAPNELSKLLATPVVGYSLAYPIGVVGMIICFQLAHKFWKVSPQEEQKQLAASFGIGGQEVLHANIKIINSEIVGKNISTIFKEYKLRGLVISRVYHEGDLEIVRPETVLYFEDIITVVGQHDLLDSKISLFGEITTEDLSSSRTRLDMRRIFVSNNDAIGKSIKSLDLQNQFGATITRVRRGDSDFVPNPETILEAGDRIRVVTLAENLKKVTKLFGDSYRRLSEIDYISMSLGIAIGLLIGSIAIPLPGGNEFKLGFAGGPLIVALFLGKIRRTKGLIWVVSYNANLTLRQLGAVLFLAGIGLKSGYTFATTFSQYGFELVLIGAIITLFVSMLTLWIGKSLFKIPYSILIGMLSGMQTQPACLAYANESVNNGGPNLGYAIVYPTAMIVKIILAQVLLWIL